MSSNSRWMRGSCDTGGNGYGAEAGGSVGSSPRSAVDLVELLGLGVVGLEHVVADRPRGRDPAVVLELAEVALPQPVQRGAVELRRAADEVVDLGLERLARSRRTRCPRRRSGCRRRPPSASQFSISRGSQSPRSRIRTRLPDGASRWASVPPPAPDPTMITSYSSAMAVSSGGGCRWCPWRRSVQRRCAGTSSASSPQAMRCGVGGRLDGGGVVAVEVVPGPARGTRRSCCARR